MRIEQLRVKGLRNLLELELRPGPRFNVLTGDNGSGKTSILEAIAILATARSFRAATLDAVVNYRVAEMSVYAEAVAPNGDRHRLGIMRPRRGRLQARVQGEAVASAANLAVVLPVQAVVPDIGALISGEPGRRRRFLDWGVFHTHAQFTGAWRRWRRALAQRNAALRQGNVSASAFDAELCAAAEEIDNSRAAYMAAFAAVFAEVAEEMALRETVSVGYRRGWDAERALRDVLDESFEADLRVGYTQHGPQRADLTIRVDGRRAAEVLSRGELKSAAFAMQAAQGRLLGSDTGSSAVFLVDDLVSELDAGHRQRAVAVLRSLEAQVFIADVAADVLRPLIATDESAWFHVKHGDCAPID